MSIHFTFKIFSRKWEWIKPLAASSLFTVSIALAMSGSNYSEKVYSQERTWRVLNVFKLVNNIQPKERKDATMNEWMKKKIYKRLRSATVIFDDSINRKLRMSWIGDFCLLTKQMTSKRPSFISWQPCSLPCNDFGTGRVAVNDFHKQCPGHQRLASPTAVAPWCPLLIFPDHVVSKSICCQG